MITFPDSPPNGTEIIDRQDDGSVIIWTYNESKNEWTYQQYGNQDPIRIFTDEVLVRDNHQELPDRAATDPSELKTQKDVNHYLNESGGTDFVSKAGDHLSGTLIWNNEPGADNKHPYVGIKILDNRNQSGDTIFLAESGGNYAKGQISTDLEPTADKHITNKLYVDKQLRESGFATEAWVESKGYVTASQVPSVDGYATEAWVEAKDYGTKNWANGRFATQAALADLQQQIDALNGLVVQAHYSYGSGISTRPGEFVVMKDNTNIQRFSACDTIRLDEVDAGNKKPALVRIIIGDTINVTDPNSGKFCKLKVTYSAGVVHQYTYEGGTLDSIPSNQVLYFRVSGETKMNEVAD